MSYYYDVEDLPEVFQTTDGHYLIEGRSFLPRSVNTEEHIKNEIELRLALLHQVQAENEATDYFNKYYGSDAGRFADYLSAGGPPEEYDADAEYDDDEFDVAPDAVEEILTDTKALLAKVINLVLDL